MDEPKPAELQLAKTLDVMVQVGWIDAYVRREDGSFSMKYSEKGFENLTLLSALLGELATVQRLDADVLWDIALIAIGEFGDNKFGPE